MISAQANDVGVDLALKSENRFDAASGVGTSVDVVAKEHHRIVPGHLALNFAQDV